MPEGKPGNNPPKPTRLEVKNPQEITIAGLGERLRHAAGNFGATHALAGILAWTGATFLHMPAAKLIAGKNYFLTDEQKSERSRYKTLLEQTILGIEKRQAEFGGKILPEAAPDWAKRILGAPIEMGSRWLGFEESKDVSVNGLRARLTGIILEDAYYEMKALLAYWLLFIAIIYYLTEPIGILLDGRREVKNRRDLAKQASNADAILYQNDMNLQNAIEKLRKEYLELMHTVATLNIKYSEGEIDPDAFKHDLIILNKKILSTLEAMNDAQN